MVFERKLAKLRNEQAELDKLEKKVKNLAKQLGVKLK